MNYSLEPQKSVGCAGPSLQPVSCFHQLRGTADTPVCAVRAHCKNPFVFKFPGVFFLVTNAKCSGLATNCDRGWSLFAGQAYLGLSEKTIQVAYRVCLLCCDGWLRHTSTCTVTQLIFARYVARLCLSSRLNSVFHSVVTFPSVSFLTGSEVLAQTTKIVRQSVHGPQSIHARCQLQWNEISEPIWPRLVWHLPVPHPWNPTRESMGERRGGAAGGMDQCWERLFRLDAERQRYFVPSWGLTKERAQRDRSGCGMTVKTIRNRQTSCNFM